MNVKPLLQITLVALGLGLASQAAMAQWQWTDKDGRKVFSDRPPPLEIAEKDILKKPAGTNRPAGTANTAKASATATADGKPSLAASAAAGAASAPKLSGKDAELEAKKKKADDEEAAKKKADDEKTAKAKAENCERAKSGLASIQSGVRLSSVNAKGEREVFDDARRNAEAKRAQEIIDSSCR